MKDAGIPRRTLVPHQKVVLAGGFIDNVKAVSVSQGHNEVLPSLPSDHEEADTRLLLHAKDASLPSSDSYTVTRHQCCCAVQSTFPRSRVPGVMVSYRSERWNEVHTTFALFAWSASLQSSSSILRLNRLQLYQCPAKNWQEDCLDNPSERKSATTATVPVWWRSRF